MYVTMCTQCSIEGRKGQDLKQMQAPQWAPVDAAFPTKVMTSDPEDLETGGSVT